MREWIAAVAIVTVALAVILGFLAAAGPSLQNLPEDVKLPLLIVVSVVALLGSIAFMVVAFAVFQLVDRQQALGLPDGSVRAIIALLLVVLFAVLTVFLTAKLGTQNTPPAVIDFAKQVLTILGTLMTSIASFYFGAKSVSDAVRVANASGPPRQAGAAPAPQSQPTPPAGVSPEPLHSSATPPETHHEPQNPAQSGTSSSVEKQVSLSDKPPEEDAIIKELFGDLDKPEPTKSASSANKPFPAPQVTADPPKHRSVGGKQES